MFMLPRTIRAHPMHQRGVTGSEYGLIAESSARVIVGLMTGRGTRLISPFPTTAVALP